LPKIAEPLIAHPNQFKILSFNIYGDKMAPK